MSKLKVTGTLHDSTDPARVVVHFSRAINSQKELLDFTRYLDKWVPSDAPPPADMSTDQAVIALVKVMELLEPLTPRARQRVLNYVRDYFDL